MKVRDGSRADGSDPLDGETLQKREWIVPGAASSETQGAGMQ